MSRLRVGSWCFALAALSCSSSADQSLPVLQRTHLAPGLLAKVASEEVALGTVQRIVRAQSVSPTVARDRAVSDALFAVGARAAFEGGSVVSVVERAAWGRTLLESLKAEAVARGPATDAEVADLTAIRWQDLDRPETSRTTHAVARVQGPDSEAKAEAVAEQIFEAVRGVSDPREFIRLAQAVPHEGVEVIAQGLPPVTPDGRIYYPDGAPPESAGQAFDKDFARAANALTPGQISAPTKSAFGYHVILCEARLPPLHVPLEERRTLLADEVIKGRAERAKQDLLGRLSRATPVLITRSVDDLTARAQVPE